MNFSIFSSNLKPRRWFRLALCGVGLIVACLLGVNLLIDPYDYFGVSPLHQQVQTNERVWKADYLKQHHNQFDAYILGSSIASQLDPKLAGELTGNRFYNLTMSGANSYDFELFVRHMLEQNYPIKRLLIVFDMSIFWSYGESGRAYESNHPIVSGDSSVEFYASYLTQIHFWGTADKIRLNLGQIPPPPHSSYDRSTGTYQYGHRMRMIEEDEEAFLADSRTLNENYLLRTERPTENFEASMAAFTRLLELCREHQIQVDLFIPPHNYNYMNRILFNQYAEYLRALTELSSFWNFSGYRESNLDNHLFFDSMHFRPNIGDLVLQRIYNDGDPADEGFGDWVDRETVEAHLETKRREFEHADTLFPTYAEKKAQAK